MQGLAAETPASLSQTELLWLLRCKRSAHFAMQLIRFPGARLEASLPELSQDALGASMSDVGCCHHKEAIAPEQGLHNCLINACHASHNACHGYTDF